MITLHQYPAAFGLSSLSPFCIKVEFFLRLAKLPYQLQDERNPARGPKGKMPFIKDHQQSITDSSFIIDYLIDKYSLQHLAVTQKKSEMIAFKSMIEDSLYFILLYSRWIDPQGYEAVVKEFTPLFPPFIGKPFLNYLRRSLTKQAHAQGLARHNRNEVYQMGTEQINALASLLGEEKYFFEGRMTAFDATAYAFLSTILKQPISSPLQKTVIGHQNLCEYVRRLDTFMEQPYAANA